MKVNTVDEERGRRAGGDARVPADQPPARLPDLRPRRRVPAAGPDLSARARARTRYVEPKRTYEKALEISDLVVLDRERCVLCWRCVRFSDEIAGDRFIQLVDRGAGTQILTFNDEPFDSYFSGNTIQICPVGALTSKPYRFVSRPWDLETAPSVCAYCSVGCPITNEARAGNDGAVPGAAERARQRLLDLRQGPLRLPLRVDPRIASRRRWSAARATSSQRSPWGDALADDRREARRTRRSASSPVGTSPPRTRTRSSKLARKRPEDERHRLAHPGCRRSVRTGARPFGRGGSTATLDDLEPRKTIVWVGPDPKETLPVLYLRLRKAVLEGGAKLTVVSPRRISLDAFATEIVRAAPGDDAAAARRSSPTSEDLRSCAGARRRPAATKPQPFAAATSRLAAASGGKLLVCPPHAGSQGMIDMGVHPAWSRLRAGRRTRTRHQSDPRGRSRRRARRAAHLRRRPDRRLPRRGPRATRAERQRLHGRRSSCFPTETALRTPTSSFRARRMPSARERSRTSSVACRSSSALLPPPGTAVEPWRACTRIASRLGEDWSWRTFDDVWTDIKRVRPDPRRRRRGGV